MPRPAKLHKFSNFHLFKRSVGYFAPYKWRVVLATIALLAYSPIPAGIAWLGKDFLDKVLIEKDIPMLKVCVVGVILLTLMKCATLLAQTFLMNATGILVLRDIRRELYHKIIRLPMPYFAESEVGMLMSRIISDVMSVRVCLPSLLMFIRQILTLVVLIGLTIYLDAYLAFWSLLVMPVAIYPFIYFGQKIRKYGRKIQSGVSGVNVVLQESFSGIKVIKAFANELKEDFNFEKENTSYTRLLIRQVLYSEGSSRVMDIIGGVAGATIIWVGGMQVVNGEMTPGELFAFMVAVLQLYDPVKKLNASNIQIQQGLAGAERVFDILDSPEINIEDQGETVFNGKLRKLAFKDVRFAYPKSDDNAVDGVSLDIEAGQRVAIVGPSGSGKTTLVNLLPRFYDVSEGAITLNGIDLRDYTLDSLRLNLGLVSQDTFLFNTSITDNIAYAQEDYDMEEVRNAARAAYAHDFIMEMPEGYDTFVGEGGVKISGGQKQRLTIARAIMKDPALLILDEATSALDTESERIVQKALDNLMQGRTSIVIAHRLSTVLSADVIVVMQDGKIIAQGRHTDLLESCPLYSRLYEMQFEDVSERDE